MNSPPVDQAERDRIRNDLSTTLFVEAGAGSGKTRALVERICALVESGVQLQNIAAITFTEKAASELRQRVRSALETATSEADNPRMRVALAQLDAAPISTLHSFAQRILFENPIEARLPPGVEVMDELASRVDFDERWDTFLVALLRDPDMAAPLLVGDVLGIGVDALRSIAQQFENNWDLLATRLPKERPELNVDLDELINAMLSLADAREGCLDPTDRLAQLLDDVGRYAASLAAAARPDADPVDRIIDVAELLCADKPQFGTRAGNPYKSKGSRHNWPDTERFEALKLELFDVGQARQRVRQDLTTAVIHHLATEIGAFVLDGVAERRGQGRLRFHDLLVLARELLRDPETAGPVGATLRHRYQRLLIDEFQDTDPIQVDLAVLLAADGPPGEKHWTETTIAPGRLFFVGDPKQSIYRFRRADMRMYLQAQKVFGGANGQVRLSANFRSTAPVIDWVNRTFEKLIQPVPGSQPRYAPLAPTRAAPETGPGVLILGADPHPGRPTAHQLRTLEAADVVGAIISAIDEQWTVAARSECGENLHRPARLSDITILLPARTSLPALEQALDQAGIAYRAETASLVYSTPEVRDLLMVARAVDDPTDELATVMALRSVAFGCGDDDLYRYRLRPASVWNHQNVAGDLPSSDPVVSGLRWLGDLHRDRPWLAPPQILDRIVTERRLLEQGVCAGRHREVWRRLRFVVDQARAWTDTIGGDLRDYLAWVRLLASDSARVAETVLPETDIDAVRIMTVHASKGLEFPITILSGLTTQPQRRRAGVHVSWPPEGPIGYRVGGTNTTAAYDNFVPLDEQLDTHERLRLLYVACTRASDHLVVSAHRGETANSSLASVLAGAGATQGWPVLTDPAAHLNVHKGRPQRAALPDVETWKTERNAVFVAAERSHTVAATALLAHAAHGALDQRPGRVRSQGAAVGRAVHAVLQTVDLATGAGLADTSAAQAAAEGLAGRESEVEALAAAALGSAAVQEAAGLPHWREIFVAAPVGDRLIEGYVDLLYRGSSGLVVLDYKTDIWQDAAHLDALVEHYRVQTAAYAVAVELSSGEVVDAAILLFLAPGGATARTILDLQAAKSEVLAMVPEI